LTVLNISGLEDSWACNWREYERQPLASFKWQAARAGRWGWAASV